MIFSNFLFLILVLLILNMAPEAIPNAEYLDVTYAFWCGIGLYALTLSLIVIQNFFLRKRLWYIKNKLFMLVNIELLFFLLTYHYIFAAHRIMEKLSFSFIYFFSILLYFVAIAVFYISALKLQSPHSRLKYAWQQSILQLRFLLPFVIPFLFFSILIDLLKLSDSSFIQDYLFNQNDSPFGSFLLFATSLVFIGVMMIFLPAFIQWMWACEPLTRQPIKQELEDLCTKAKFKHAGMKIWTIFNQSMTAAIIGIVPRFRYVMFTNRLLDSMPNRLTVAVLAHEIGHSYRKHLLLFPFILFGMIVGIGLFSMWFTPGLIHYLNLKYLLSHSSFWENLAPFAIFVPFAILMALYFRYIFGYFSRIFERQADLHCYQVDIPPEDMVEALDHLGTATGNTHSHPSWHHYSIQQRIDFLRTTEHNASLINKHHRRVKRSLVLYLIILVINFLILFASQLNFAPFTQINQWNESLSHNFTGWVTSPLRKQAAEDYIHKYNLPQNDAVQHALAKGLMHMDAANPGIAEFYAALELFHSKEFSASMTLLSAALRQVNPVELRPKALHSFRQLAIALIKQAQDKPELAAQSLELESALHVFQKKKG